MKMPVPAIVTVGICGVVHQHYRRSRYTFVHVVVGSYRP
jgi:hypothetical protein